MELDKMTADELIDLKKQIEKKLKDTDHCKYDLTFYKTLRDIFNDRLATEGLDEKYGRSAVLSKLDASILKLCDVTLGNYTISEVVAKPAHTRKQMFCNGSKISPNFDLYSQMANELVAVVEKYAFAYVKEDAEQ